jgi:hypothetical protein
MNLLNKKRKLTASNFERLGYKRFAYIKVKELDDGEESFEIFHANGDKLAVRYNQQSAAEVLEDNYLTSLPLH